MTYGGKRAERRATIERREEQQSTSRRENLSSMLALINVYYHFKPSRLLDLKRLLREIQASAFQEVSEQLTTTA